VILYDDLAADPAAVMRDLYLFLGVDAAFAVDVSTRHNAGAMPRLPTLNWLLWKSIAGVRRASPRCRRALGSPPGSTAGFSVRPTRCPRPSAAASSATSATTSRAPAS
jgi:hypothetical protein